MTDVVARFDDTVGRWPERLAVVDGLDGGSRRTWSQLADDVEHRTTELRAGGAEPGVPHVFVEPNSLAFVVTFLAALRIGALAVPLGEQLTSTEVEGHRAAAHAATGATGGALVAFSSGSTGMPKPMVRTHANLVAEADQFAATVGVAESDVILTVVPLAHAHGLGNCLLASIGSGAALVLGVFERDATLAAIGRERVTIYPGVPFMFDALAATRRAERAQLASLRLCFSAGAPLARETFDAFAARFGHPVRQLYGCSEAGSVSINLHDDAEGTWASVGRPMIGVDVSIEAPGDDGTGELRLRSRAATTGYLGAAGLQEQFADGWFRPGDLAHVGEDGTIWITGRTTSFISTSGFKVDPVDVERVIAHHPDVAEVVVVGAPGERASEIVKAVVVPRGTVDEAALRADLVGRCRQALPVHKVPRIVEFRAEIPRSPLGKILRKYLV